MKSEVKARLVSIVLPTFNSSKYIRVSLDSLLRQTYRNIEIIVVDGGSRDTTLEIVADIDDSRIRIVHQPNNTGRLPGALNLGFDNASGDYFTWTQDDDYFSDNAIEVLATALEANPDVGLAYTGYWWIDEQGNITSESELGPPEMLYKWNAVGHCFMYRRSVAEAVGDYDPNFVMAEDFQYWVRIYRYSKLLFLPGYYAYHRWHPGSLSGRDYGRYESLRVCARARRQILKIGWVDYQRQLAAADIEEAFSAYMRPDYGRVRSRLFRGLIRDPGWLRNKGVLSIGLESVLGKKMADLYRGRRSAATGSPAE